MPRLDRPVGCRGLLPAIFVLPIVFSASLSAQVTRVKMSVDTVIAAPGEQLVAIRVHIDKYTDTIVAFKLWFLLDRPDICTFAVDSTTFYDTTYWQCTNGTPANCLDSVLVGVTEPWDFIHVQTYPLVAGGLSVANGMIENWQTIDGRSLSGLGYDLNLTASANSGQPGSGPIGILPGQSGLLFTLIVNCLDLSDTVTDRIANILPSRFSFSNPQGEMSALVCDTVSDTVCYRCQQWVDSICISWTPVIDPPYDSCQAYFDINCFMDTAAFEVGGGSITLCWTQVAGDVNDDGHYDSDDLAALMDFALYGAPPLVKPTNGDVNGDCYINWEDINLLNAGGPYTNSCCPNPVWSCCIGMRGNVDYDVTNGQDDIDVMDLSRLVRYMFKGGQPPLCRDEANVDGDPANSVDIADISTLVNYMFRSGASPASCGR